MTAFTAIQAPPSTLRNRKRPSASSAAPDERQAHLQIAYFRPEGDAQRDKLIKLVDSAQMADAGTTPSSDYPFKYGDHWVYESGDVRTVSLCLSFNATDPIQAMERFVKALVSFYITKIGRDLFSALSQHGLLGFTPLSREFAGVWNRIIVGALVFRTGAEDRLLSLLEDAKNMRKEMTPSWTKIASFVCNDVAQTVGSCGQQLWGFFQECGDNHGRTMGGGQTSDAGHRIHVLASVAVANLYSGWATNADDPALKVLNLPSKNENFQHSLANLLDTWDDVQDKIKTLMECPLSSESRTKKSLFDSILEFISKTVDTFTTSLDIYKSFTVAIWGHSTLAGILALSGPAISTIPFLLTGPIGITAVAATAAAATCFGVLGVTGLNLRWLVKTRGEYKAVIAFFKNVYNTATEVHTYITWTSTLHGTASSVALLESTDSFKADSDPTKLFGKGDPANRIRYLLREWDTYRDKNHPLTQSHFKAQLAVMIKYREDIIKTNKEILELMKKLSSGEDQDIEMRDMTVVRVDSDVNEVGEDPL